MTSGRIITRAGQTALVEADSEVIECRLRRSVGHVVCGDFVEFDSDKRVLTRLLARESTFARADKRGRKQIIAANLDLIVIVVAPKPEPTRDLINRYLVACHNVDTNAALFFNKTDLINEDEKETWRQREAQYRDLGHPVLSGSAKQDSEVDALRTLIGQRTAILVGQSGVGKSSLINRLLVDLDLRTRQISDSTGKGRHTTTASTLYRLPGGGAIIDSPGVWEYGIWQMEAAEVAAGFPDFQPLIGQCRFANCTHTVEPGCALDAAAKQTIIDPERLASYRRIVATA